jgi:hypothetical protein
MQNRRILELAMILLNAYRKDFVDYEEACEEWHRKGYRPHYCIHGTNLWVEWDCACGACENGEDTYWDYATYLRRSLDEAKAAFDTMHERVMKVIDLQNEGAPIDLKVWSEWIHKPLTSRGWQMEANRKPRDLSHLV